MQFKYSSKNVVIVWLCIYVFILHQSSLLPLQWLYPLKDMGVLDIGFDPDSQRSSCCTCTLCILTITQHHVTEKNIVIAALSVTVKVILNLLWWSDLGIKRGLVSVKQLFHTLTNLRRDVPGLKCGYILPHTTLSQKATKRTSWQTKTKQKTYKRNVEVFLHASKTKQNTHWKNWEKKKNDTY